MNSKLFSQSVPANGNTLSLNRVMQLAQPVAGMCLADHLRQFNDCIISYRLLELALSDSIISLRAFIKGMAQPA